MKLTITMIGIVAVATTACSVQPVSTLLSSDVDKLHGAPSFKGNKFDMNIVLGDGDGVVLSGSKVNKAALTVRFQC